MALTLEPILAFFEVYLVLYYHFKEGGKEGATGRYIFSFPNCPVPGYRTILDGIDRFEKCGKIKHCFHIYDQQNFISGEKFGKSLEEDVKLLYKQINRSFAAKYSFSNHTFKAPELEEVMKEKM